MKRTQALPQPLSILMSTYLSMAPVLHGAQPISLRPPKPGTGVSITAPVITQLTHIVGGFFKSATPKFSTLTEAFPLLGQLDPNHPDVQALVQEIQTAAQELVSKPEMQESGVVSDPEQAQLLAKVKKLAILSHPIVQRFLTQDEQIKVKAEYWENRAKLWPANRIKLHVEAKVVGVSNQTSGHRYWPEGWGLKPAQILPELPEFPQSRQLTIRDIAWLKPILASEQGLAWIYNLPDLLFYQSQLGEISLSRYKGAILIMEKGPHDAVFSYKPLGVPDDAAASIISELLSRSVKFSAPIAFKAIPERLARDPWPDAVIEHDRSLDTYVYSSESLATLRGRAFLKHRGHIHAFRRRYPGARYVNLSDAANWIPKVKEFLDYWFAQKMFSSRVDQGEAVIEISAQKKLLDHVSELDLQGGVLVDNDKVIGVAVGVKRDANTLTSLMRKADRSYRGAYQYLTRRFVETAAFAQNIPQVDFQYAGGDEGLRQSKLGYHPIELRAWYTIRPSLPGLVSATEETPQFPLKRALSPTDQRVLEKIFHTESHLNSWIYNAVDLVTYVPKDSPVYISSIDGALLIMLEKKPNELTILNPLGVSDVKASRIIREVLARGVLGYSHIRFEAIQPTVIEAGGFRGDLRFTIVTNDDLPTYYYDTKELATLSGKKYHNKRNHVSQFVRAYPDFEYRDLRESPDLPPKLKEFWRLWVSQKKLETPAEKEEAELGAKNFDDVVDGIDRLGLSGAVILVHGRITAFTLAARKSKDTIVILEEKGDRQYPGSYQAINKLFAERYVVPHGYRFIERQSDAGFAGMRQAKLTYHPVVTVPWYIIEVVSTRP